MKQTKENGSNSFGRSIYSFEIEHLKCPFYFEQPFNSEFGNERI